MSNYDITHPSAAPRLAANLRPQRPQRMLSILSAYNYIPWPKMPSSAGRTCWDLSWPFVHYPERRNTVVDDAAARECKSCAESNPSAAGCVLGSRSGSRSTFSARRCTTSSARLPSSCFPGCASFQACCSPLHRQICKRQQACPESCPLAFPPRQWVSSPKSRSTWMPTRRRMGCIYTLSQMRRGSARRSGRDSFSPDFRSRLCAGERTVSGSSVGLCPSEP